MLSACSIENYNFIIIHQKALRVKFCAQIKTDKPKWFCVLKEQLLIQRRSATSDRIPFVLFRCSASKQKRAK